MKGLGFVCCIGRRGLVEMEALLSIPCIFREWLFGFVHRFEHCDIPTQQRRVILWNAVTFHFHHRADACATRSMPCSITCRWTFK